MTSQPTVPGYTPRDDEDLDPAPDAAAPREGMEVQGTPVIDATKVDADQIDADPDNAASEQ